MVKVASGQARRSLCLAMVLFRYFPWGGMQANFLRIAKACLARGHRVDVYTLGWQGGQAEGLKLNILDVSGRRNITRYTHFSSQVQALTSTGNYDLVLGFNRMPGLDLYYAADPCFVERVRKTRPWYYPLTARYRHFQGVEKALFSANSSTRILALSQIQIDEYTRNYSTQRSRFSLLPPAVQQRYRKDENADQLRQVFRQRYGLLKQNWVLLMIGSAYKRKGMDRCLRAVAALPAEICDLCRLFVLGKGREKPLRRLAKRLGLEKQLTIISGTDEVPLYLQGADLLIHAARSENTGNVIVEAIAAGLPVLCAEHCGYAVHLARADAGLVIKEPFEQAAMNAQLLAMLQENKLVEWQNMALKYAGHEDLYSRTEKVIELIEEQASCMKTYA